MGFSAFLLGLFYIIEAIAQSPRIIFNQFIISGIIIRSLY